MPPDAPPDFEGIPLSRTQWKIHRSAQEARSRLQEIELLVMSSFVSSGQSPKSLSYEPMEVCGDENNENNEVIDSNSSAKASDFVEQFDLLREAVLRAIANFVPPDKLVFASPPQTPETFYIRHSSLMQGNWGRCALQESKGINEPVLRYSDFLRQHLVKLSVMRSSSLHFGLLKDTDDVVDALVEAINAIENLKAKEWSRQRVESSRMVTRHNGGARIIKTGK